MNNSQLADDSSDEQLELTSIELSNFVGVVGNFSLYD